MKGLFQNTSCTNHVLEYRIVLCYNISIKVTANPAQPSTKEQNNDTITLKENRISKGVNIMGKNTGDQKAGSSQGMGSDGE